MCTKWEMSHVYKTKDDSNTKTINGLFKANNQ